MREIDKSYWLVAPTADERDNQVTIVWESEDYTTPDGYFHRDGIHRVKAFYTASGTSYARAKTFKGETAFSRAENLYEDLIWKARNINS